MWKDVPKNILLQLGLIKSPDDNCIDLGCDILCQKHDGNYVFIQCKNYSTTGVDNTITSASMGLFFVLSYQFNFESYLYYSGKIGRNLLNIDKRKVFINLPYVSIGDNNKSFKIYDNIIPRIYQIQALNTLQNQKRSILQMPCGTGKTFVSYLLSLDYDNIILLSPLISTTEQILDNYRNYYCTASNVLFTEINCSTNRTPTINYNKKNVIAATYKSCDVINKILPKLKNTIIIIDEFHNLSKANITNKEDEINKILESDSNILFMSATPKVLLANESYANYFGTVKYELSWRDAIDNKYICNINLVYPDKQEIDSYSKDLCKIAPRLNEIISEKNNLEKINQILFILSRLKKDNSNKCIQYYKSRAELDKYVVLIKIISELIDLKVDIYAIDFSTKKSERKVILDKFKTCTNCQIICNVYVLNEGIDIPACDSIFLIHPTYDPTNMIQRMNRCNRLDFNKPNKIGNVYIWSEEIVSIEILYNDLVGITPNKIVSNLGNIVNKVKNNNEIEVAQHNNIIEQKPHNNNNKSERISFKEFLKNNSSIDSEFIDNFIDLFNDENEDNIFVVDFDVMVKWLEVNKYEKFLRNSKKGRQLGIDYTNVKIKIKNKPGIPRKKYYFTAKAAKEICQLSRKPKGEITRKYFVEIDGLMNKYYNKVLNINT